MRKLPALRAPSARHAISLPLGALERFEQQVEIFVRASSSSGTPRSAGAWRRGARPSRACSHNASASAADGRAKASPRPIVDDGGFHAVFARQPVRQRLRHGEMRVARFAHRRSLRASAFTARCRSPSRTAAIVCERLCQSITNRAPRRRDAATRSRASAPPAGSARGSRRASACASGCANSRTACPTARTAELQTKRRTPPLRASAQTRDRAGDDT